MSQHESHGPHLTRRSWITLTLSALSGCGGGGGDIGSGSASLPGTGGTGMYAMGSIQGFGSVILNSIKFDDTQAQILLDGSAIPSAALRLGMVAQVQGVRASSATPATATQPAMLATATASVIEVWSVAQGRISQVNGNQFTLAGMMVQTNSATVLDGLSSISQLAAQLYVTVWGLQAGADGSVWTATRIALNTSATDTGVVSTGLVSVSNELRQLNGLRLTGTVAANVAAGTLVRVVGNLASTGDSLAVTELRTLGTSSTAQGEAEIEGVVTALLSAHRFMLGSIEVDTSNLSSTLALALSERVEVSGSWQQGVLYATRLEPEDEFILSEVEITALIEVFTSLSNFVVRGHRCDASGITSVGNGTLADLKVGARVKVHGLKAGDVLIVTEIEVESGG